MFRTAEQTVFGTKYTATVPGREYAATRLSGDLANRMPANMARPVAAHQPAAIALYRLYRAAVYARCRRLLDSADEAEDATQEVFIRVLNHLQTIPAGQGARPWLHRIATNYCFNKLRDRKLRQLRTQESVAVADIDCTAHAEEQAIRRDIARQVLAALSPTQRTVVVLHYVNELDQQEVADTLGISRRTVVNRLAALNDIKSSRLRELACEGTYSSSSFSSSRS